MMRQAAFETGPVGSIVTLTMNPALDVSTSVPGVLPDQKLRCEAPRYEPGGGGINVARAVRRLVGDALACFPIAGPPGELLRDLLQGEGVRQNIVAVRGWTRENLNVLEHVSGRQFRFCMPRPVLGEDEWPRFLEWVERLDPVPDFVVASGSLPPGVPADFYARLARLVRRIGSRLVLDTSGAPLLAAVSEGVYLLKPSLREFRTLSDTQGSDESGLAALATAAVREQRWCEVLVLSLGAGGALWADATGVLQRRRYGSKAASEPGTAWSPASCSCWRTVERSATRSVSESPPAPRR
jgi:6-phosphofructokinase 2